MSRIKEIRAGFGYMKKGFSFFWQNKKLWWYAIIPTAINLLVLIGLFYLLIHYFGDITGWIFGTGDAESAVQAGFFLKIWHGLLSTLVFIAKALIFLVMFVFIFIATFVFSLILTEPFNDTMSEKVEQLATGQGEISFNWNYFMKSISRSLVVGLQKAAFFLTIPVILLLLNLIPVAGGIAYLIIANLFAAFDIGFNFTDYPMSRKLWSFGKRMKAAWRRKNYLIGFGIVVLIPLFPYIFSAQLVTGGTLMFSEVFRDENE